MKKIYDKKENSLNNKYLERLILSTKFDLKNKEEEWNDLKKNNNDLSFFDKVSIKDIIIASYDKIVKYQVIYRETSLYKEFENYRRGLKSSKSKPEEKVEIKENYGKQIDTYEKLKEIFDYDKYSQEIRSFFIESSDKLNINICYYCDTAYTGFFEESDGIIKGQFELDHFFSKDKYPFLALSLYNFVPSCHWCNSYKHDNDWEIKEESKEISPISSDYSFDENVKIRVEPKLVDDNENKDTDNKKNEKDETKSNNKQRIVCYGDNFADNLDFYKIVFDFNEKSEYDTLIKNLHLEERYNMASIKSVALNLLDLKKKYPPQHINEISEIFTKNNIHISEDEICKFIFNGNQDKRYSLLNKLRRDILDWEPKS